MPRLTPAVIKEIDEAASRESIGEIIRYLRNTLGPHVAAYLVGADDDVNHGPSLSDVEARRLRDGYRVVRMIETPYDAQTAVAWLFGSNTQLADLAPIELLASATAPEDFDDVLIAARDFAATG